MMELKEKSEKLYEAVTGISDELIAEAEGYSFERKKPYLKWGLAVAACLCLFCAGVMSGVLLADNGKQPIQEQTQAGNKEERFQFLVQNMAMNFANNTSQGNQSDVLASNYMNISTDSYNEIADLYRLYGVTSGEKIERIVFSQGQAKIQMQTKELTDEDVLEEFYLFTSSLVRYDTTTFFEEIIDKMTEEEIREFHAECRMLEITTKDGLVFSYNLYQESGYLYSAGTMSYYILSDEFIRWSETNLE